jgi:acetyltransferase-like isoleucine patch superfamily enzyme
VEVESDVFIGPAVVFTNDLRPRSKKRPDKYCSSVLKEGCSIGANATVLPVVIGRWAMVGAGSVVTRNVPDFALVAGNPARIRGWVCRCGDNLLFQDGRAKCACERCYFQAEGDRIQETGTTT